jgi:hypothetical protein
MAADRLTTQAKHIRDAKLWAVVIIGAALFVAAADLVTHFSRVSSARNGVEKLSKHH